MRDRLSAVVALYDITPGGEAAVRGLDVRWMQDQPGFFGSFGYKSWAGVGEARPTGVMHELSHSYWGLFPVTGLPGLSWDAPEGKAVSPAIDRYNRDILTFMTQPPDHFERLGARLRNLPKVSAQNPEPLFHHAEADAIYSTGGDLDLVLPILRKYWDSFLTPGPFHSWYEAFRWYQGLPVDQRRLADKYLGFEHFDLRNEASPVDLDGTSLAQGVEEVLEREETRRLRDFVGLFDLLVGVPEHQEDFKFWRRYLRDKIDLHQRHPELVVSLNLPRSRELDRALDLLVGIEDRSPEEKVDAVLRGLDQEPFLAHFLPALDNRTLLALFTSEARLHAGATLKGTAAFVESLERFIPHVKRILEAARRDLSQGAGELTSYLNRVDFGEKEGLELFFEILQGSDGDVARGVVSALDDSMLRRLLVPVPTTLRVLLQPDRYLRFLAITLDSPPQALARGLEDMVRYPSGNFLIDEPFLDEMYRVVVARGRIAPLETLNAVAVGLFPMERFIRLHPRAAVDILAGDLDVTSKMVIVSDPIIFPPARFVYRLIYADPEFAGRVLVSLDELGEIGLVVEALAQIAYDADRLAAVPTLTISLLRYGRFLEGLLDGKGEEWLEKRLGEAVSLYGRRVENGEVGEEFLVAYQRTLRAAALSLEEPRARRTLEGIVDRVFR